MFTIAGRFLDNSEKVVENGTCISKVTGKVMLLRKLSKMSIRSNSNYCSGFNQMSKRGKCIFTLLGKINVRSPSHFFGFDETLF